ncbi:MAG: hypothetical protein B7Z55_03405, partial [Planctomycetales bacterium 12-60-4]
MPIQNWHFSRSQRDVAPGIKIETNSDTFGTGSSLISHWRNPSTGLLVSAGMHAIALVILGLIVFPQLAADNGLELIVSTADNLPLNDVS